VIDKEIHLTHALTRDTFYGIEHLKRTEKALIKFKEKFGSEAKNSPASPATVRLFAYRTPVATH
jgi:hypothetical protein